MQRTVTEIVIDDMIILDSRKSFEEAGGTLNYPKTGNNAPTSVPGVGYVPAPAPVTSVPVEPVMGVLPTGEDTDTSSASAPVTPASAGDSTLKKEGKALNLAMNRQKIRQKHQLKKL